MHRRPSSAPAPAADSAPAGGLVRIAVDAMGGDRAPKVPVAGAFAAAAGDGIHVLLVGQRERVEPELEALGDHGGRIEVVQADEVVGMDEPATTPLRKKRRSSIRIAAELVKSGEAQAMVTAGNTGAAMAAAMLVMGTIPGVDRPALAAVLPNRRGRTVLLDVGANVTTKPHHLRQFAVMGHFYAQEVLATPSPRVGLMSVGEEEGKGTELTREVFRVLKGAGLDFVGNVEGGDVFSGAADVVVCDGFVGNVLLKSSESMAVMLAEMLEGELRATRRTRLGALLALPALRALRQRTDPNSYGAAPLLGVQGGCFIGHGSSTPTGIRNAVRRAMEFVVADLHTKIRQQMAVMHRQEERVMGAPGADGP
ncbi:MAG TPA: phosphate acyltransferase PlsX [Thermoanaerobaculia bacterium]|nr:phosphate acyltransferase PlsX [Thermoanaerobaculia bacterium]